MRYTFSTGGTSRHPERNDQFRRGNGGETRRRQAGAAPVAHPAKHRGDRDAGQDRQREADHHAEPGRRAQPGEHRERGVQDGIEARRRPERGPERHRGETAVDDDDLPSLHTPRDPESGETEDAGDKAGKHGLVPRRQVIEHPGVGVRRAREVGAPVRRIPHRLVERSPEAFLALQLAVRQKRGRHQRDGDDRARDQAEPEGPAGPQPPHRHDDEHAEAHHQNGEDTVVAATERGGGHHRAEGRAPADRWTLDQPVERQHRERQAGRHQQLDVRQVREHKRAEREADGRDGRAPPIACQVSNQVVGADRGQQEREQHGGIVRGVRISRGPIDGNRERAGREIGLGVREGARVRVEDVGVEEVAGIGDERSGDPRHVPDRELAVAVVHPADAAHVERDRVRQTRRQHRGRGQHTGQFDPAAPDRLTVPPRRGVRRAHRAGLARTAENLIITPRFRLSSDAGTRRCSVKPSLDRTDSR